MAPVLSIARFVEDVRILVPAPDETVAIESLPTGRTSLVIRVPEGGAADAHVIGPRTRAKFKRATGIVRAATIRFKPGWSPSLFGVPANELTDQMIALDDLWGDISADLVEAQSIDVLLGRLSRAFAARTPRESASALLARRAARMFEATETRVDAVAQQLGVTARHLHRAFIDSVGLSPKQFARGVRLQRAIREAARSRDWGVIARQAGYYDQAHLIAEFRDLVGLTPRAYLARLADTSPDCKVSSQSRYAS